MHMLPSLCWEKTQRSNPDIVKELKDAGNGIGHHTYDHQILTSLSQDQISSEISKANEAIQNGAGVPADTLSFRPGGKL